MTRARAATLGALLTVGSTSASSAAAEGAPAPLPASPTARAVRDALGRRGPAEALASRFVFAGDVLRIPLPRVEGGACTLLALVGPRGLGFSAKLDAPGDGAPAPAVDPTDEPEASDEGAAEPGESAAASSGVATLRRCQGAAPRRVDVRVESGRGALELVVASTDANAAAALRDALPDRAPLRPPPAALGPATAARAQRERRIAALDRAALDGFTSARVDRLVLDEAGRGELSLPARFGCHRVDVLDTDGGTPRDLDGELRAESDERTLARDQAEARDVRLDTCVPDDDVLRLRVVGGRPGDDLTVLASSVDPVATSALRPEAAAELARLRVARGLGALDPSPVLRAQVGSGATTVTFAGRPGRCYAAVAAASLGRPRGVGLRVTTPRGEALDERGGDLPVALAPVCFDGATTPRARIDVVVRGAGVAADLAVFEVGARLLPPRPLAEETPRVGAGGKDVP